MVGTARPDDDMIEDFDLEHLTRTNQIAGHFDVRLRRRRVAAGMIVLCVAKVYV